MKKLATLLLATAACSLFALTARSENEISVSPEPGVVEQLSQFVISFDGEWSLSNRSAKFTLTGPEGVTIPNIYSYSDGSHYIVYFEDDAVVDAPGDYVFTVPAGKFAINGVDLPAYTFEYTIASGGEGNTFPAYTITPEAGDYNSLSTFTITLDTTEPVTVNPAKILLTGPTDSYGFRAEVEGSTITLTPSDSYGDALTFTAVGSYTLNIGVGALKAGDATNPEMIFVDYTIGGEVEAWDGTYTADPPSGSEVDELSEVFITLEGVTTVTISDNARPGDFPMVYNLDTDNYTTCMGFATGNILDISVSRNITDPGRYRLVVPSAFYRADGKETGVEISLEYEIKASGEAFFYTCYFIPSNSALAPNDGMTMVFEAENLKKVTIDEYAWGNSAPHITNEFGAYNPNLQITAVDDTSFMFTHPWPFEESGVYTLIIPAGYFTLTDEADNVVKNARIEHMFEVDMSLGAVKAVNEEGLENNDVYSVDGTVVLRNATEKEIEMLPAGIYVINNRVIKK